MLIRGLEIDVEYNAEGEVTNIITQDHIDNLKKVWYSGEDGDEEPVSLSGVKYFININNVNIGGTNLTEFPEDLLDLSKLHTIRLIGTTFDQANPSYKDKPEPFELPERLKDLKNLRHLVLNNTRITEIPSWITEMTSLTTLNLTGSNYSTDNKDFLLPEDIDKLINLRDLSISNNDMKKLPDNLHLLKNLKSFRFVNNSLEEITDDNYEFIKALNRKYVFNQEVIIQGGEKNAEEDVNIEMPEIVDFLLQKEGQEEGSIKFIVYEYNDDYTEVIDKFELSIDEVYKDGKFILSKEKIEKNKNYRFLSKKTSGLFETSYFNYYFTTVEADDPDTGDETPDDPDMGDDTPEDPDMGDETPEDPDTGDETPEDPDMGDETPEDPDTGDETPEDPDTGDETPEDPDVKEEAPQVMEKVVMPYNNSMLPKAGEKDSNLLSVAILFILTSIGSLFTLFRKK